MGTLLVSGDGVTEDPARILDVQALEALVADLGGFDAATSALTTFCRSIFERLGAAHAAWAAHDVDSLGIHLREMAASSAMFRADRLAATCAELVDRLDRHSNGIPIEAMELIDDLCEVTVMQMRRYLASQPL